MFEKAITLLFVSGDPLTYNVLAEQLGCTKEEVIANAQVLKTSLESIGLTLIITREDISISTKQEYSPVVEAYRKKELESDLTPAALQVLTLVSYLGSSTQEQISYIRGVHSMQSIRTLLARGLISKTGASYFLSALALAYLGITQVEELPDYNILHTSFLEKLQTNNAE